MEGARIVVFEDRPYEQEIVQEIVEAHGHTVVATGTTVDESLAVVQSMASGEVEADVVILDGNLTPGKPTNGEDARRIRAAIDSHELGVKVVGYSGVRAGMEKTYGIPVDGETYKESHRLPDVIASL